MTRYKSAVQKRNAAVLLRKPGRLASQYALFLRFEDNRGLTRNTLKQKCIHLKHFYTFLHQKRIKHKDVTVDDLASYIAWLKYPDIPEKIITLNMEPRFREQCINANVDTVIGFYNYLLLHDDLENTLSEKLVKFVRTPGKGYRSFLHGIAENKRQKRYLLHLPVPKNVIRTVTKDEVNELLKAVSNVRDYFLLYLLFETGMRIGEALSLWLRI